jgi:hypothetical protein
VCWSINHNGKLHKRGLLLYNAIVAAIKRGNYSYIQVQVWSTSITIAETTIAWKNVIVTSIK